MQSWYLDLPQWAQHVIFPIVRWLHVVCTCALVGGTLFYEFVIPKAIEDLKDEAQLAVLGRVRWIFRRIVVWSAFILIVTGAVTTWRSWAYYQGIYEPAKRWWSVHVGLGVIAMAIAVRITIGDRVPKHPIRWLRINLVILLVAIFAAALVRYVRLTISEQMAHNNPNLRLKLGPRPFPTTNPRVNPPFNPPVILPPETR